MTKKKTVTGQRKLTSLECQLVEFGGALVALQESDLYVKDVEVNEIDHMISFTVVDNEGEELSVISHEYPRDGYIEAGDFHDSIIEIIDVQEAVFKVSDADDIEISLTDMTPYILR